MAVTNTEWNINTDIYDIVESVDNLKQRYIEDENESTLAVGIFGFLSDTEAKKIQTSTIMAGELGNEMFPTRAKLTKNVLTHAAYSSIKNILATPARITLNIGLSLEDLEANMESNQFIFDHMSAIFIGDYEFHTDYDIIISRSKKNSTSTDPNAWSYTAQYRTVDENGELIVNRLSTIRNQYIMQPFVTMLDNQWYLIFQVTLHQCTIETTTDKIISDSIIANKTYSFTYDDQLADFDVFITRNSNRTRLTPFLYGTDTGKEELFCRYLFLNDNKVRISFDPISFQPGLNDEIEIVARTCLGEDGNFEYIKIDETSEGFYFDITSETYNYNSLNCYAVAVTDSLYGNNQKSKTELQKMIPKASMARGSLTNETDINNYFNLIESEENRIILQKKIDNQLYRIWYAYLVLKDQFGNVIPTNTIKLHIDLDSSYWTKSPDNRIVIPAGTGIVYNKDTMIGEIIDIADIPNPIDNAEYFGDNYYYVTYYSMLLDRDPLYAAFYMTCIDESTYFAFKWINTDAPTQFVANRITYRRNLLTDQYEYKFKFSIAQSLLVDFGLYSSEEETIIRTKDDGTEYYENEVIETLNLKVIFVLFNSSNVPYRWKECNFNRDTFKDDNSYIYDFTMSLITDNAFDNKNNMRINDMYIRGTRDISYGYFAPKSHARIYILGKFDSEEHDPVERGIGEYCLDNIAPGYYDYIVTNIYDIQDDINFYDNYTDYTDAVVTSQDEEGMNFLLSGVPVVGGQYINIDYDDVEDNAAYLMDVITEKKAYIDYCLELLENSMKVDYKLFNTYGPSLTYVTEEGDSINHVDLTMRFQVSLKYASDYSTKDSLIEYIKKKVEDLYETGDLHIPNLITDITNNYNQYINYIEFIGFNHFDPSIQHILKQDLDDPSVVPEFLNIRNSYYGDAKNLQSCIEIELV